jgi:hypothetical protein
VGRAVLEGKACAVAPGSSDNDSGLPFGVLPEGRGAIAVPLHVGGRTVAVIYGDDVDGAEKRVPAGWPETLELLARHAARCLEVITASRRAAGSGRAVEAVAEVRRSGLVSEALWAEDEARRFARHLVSGVKRSNQMAVLAGRENHDLLNRLRPALDEARRIYEEQVPQAVSARRLYFDQEVLRTLANGDPRLLGY